jgi:hypothetical protein
MGMASQLVGSEACTSGHMSECPVIFIFWHRLFQQLALLQQQ